jgi:hypothetical protein
LALRAKLSFDGHIIFEISRSEISKMMCPSKDNILPPQAAETFLHNLV